MQAATLGKKHYQLLGKLLMNTHPNTAKELLNIYCSDLQPTEFDLSKIEAFYKSFCILLNIESDESTEVHQKTDKVNKRRLFIAAMLHIYSPHLYLQPIDNLIIQKGFIKTLSTTLNQDKGNISRMIRDVICHCKVYDEFKSKADEIFKLLTCHGKA